MQHIFGQVRGATYETYFLINLLWSLHFISVYIECYLMLKHSFRDRFNTYMCLLSKRFKKDYLWNWYNVRIHHVHKGVNVCHNFVCCCQFLLNLHFWLWILLLCNVHYVCFLIYYNFIDKKRFVININLGINYLSLYLYMKSILQLHQKDKIYISKLSVKFQ